MINIKKINLTNLLNNLKLDDKKKIPLILLIFIVIVYIDFMTLMKLQLRALKAKAPQLAKLKEEISSLARDLSKIQDLEQGSGGKGQPETTKLKKIISEEELPLLLETISVIANQNKVRIIQINTPKDTKIKEEAKTAERFLPINITLELSCNYHALGAFINSLEKARYFIELQDMKIIRDSRDYFLESITLTLKTYAKRENS